MPNFEYYLHPNNEVRIINHIEALQLSSHSFVIADERRFKKHVAKLMQEYAPEKNNNSPEAQKCYQRIQQAYDALKDPAERARHRYIERVVNEGTLFAHVSPVVNLGLVEMGADLAKNREALNQINLRLQHLSTEPKDDSLEKITNYLTTLCRQMKGFSQFDLHEQLNQLVEKIRARANTAEEYYALELLFRADRYREDEVRSLHKRDGYTSLQKAAAKGHIIAIAELAANALAGHYAPLDKSTKWGLQALRYLEKQVIPAMERENPGSEVLDKIKKEIRYLRDKRKDILPAVIPSEPAELDNLVAKYLDYRTKRGYKTVATFILDENLFDLLSKNEPVINRLPTTPAQIVGQKKEQEPARIESDVIAAFKHQLDTLKYKINDFELRKSRLNPNDVAGRKALNDAHEKASKLHKKLTDASTAYFSNPTKATYKEFKRVCNKQIFKARPTLEKHRGWKRVLGNLLLAIAGLGVLYLLAVACNKAITGNFLFFDKTESAKIVDAIEESAKETRLR